MKNIQMKDLTLGNFNKYGSFANMINPKACKIGEEPVEFYRDLATLELGQTHTASFSVCRVSKRSMVIDNIEYHNYTGEGMLPLDGDVILYFAPATPEGIIPYDSFEAFRVPKGTMITIRPGVWHCGAFASEAEYVNVLIVLPERCYVNDCKVFNMPEDKRIEIKE
jgi:ureidoglycolate lyase